jgi:hypothetical protein
MHPVDRSKDAEKVYAATATLRQSGLASIYQILCGRKVDQVPFMVIVIRNIVHSNWKLDSIDKTVSSPVPYTRFCH